MQEYEAVWEIFNQCANNQMRDVLSDEVKTDDPELFIKDKFKGRDVSYEKTVLEDGTVIFDILASGLKQKYTFTRI